MAPAPPRWLAFDIRPFIGSIGFTFVRGTHGGTYVLDPEGVDELPAGNAIRPNA